MKQIAAIIVFFSLMVLSLFLGYANYVTAKESLYTLVRRLKPIVESNTNLKVVADKGGYYRLSIKMHDSQLLVSLMSGKCQSFHP